MKPNLTQLTTEAFHPRLAESPDASNGWRPEPESINSWQPGTTENAASTFPELQRGLGNIAKRAFGLLAEPTNDPDLSLDGIANRRKEIAARELAALNTGYAKRVEAAIGEANRAENDLRRDVEAVRKELSAVSIARAQASIAEIQSESIGNGEPSEIIANLRDAIEQGDTDAIETGILFSRWGSHAGLRELADQHFQVRVNGGADRVRVVEAWIVQRDVVGLHLEQIRDALSYLAQTGEPDRDITADELIARGIAQGEDSLGRRAERLGLLETRPSTMQAGADGAWREQMRAEAAAAGGAA